MSLAQVLASELERLIYQIKLSGPGIGNAKFAKLMASVLSGALVVLEDIDCAFVNREAAATGCASSSTGGGAHHDASSVRHSLDIDGLGTSMPGTHHASGPATSSTVL